MIRAFVNGKIYVSFKPIKIVEAIVVANEKIIYAGESEKAQKLPKSLEEK
ncbi:hypothetical protein OCC_05906 [Thermococcus litoralis DSM 5473]|uniref:Uncharacterized protein n=1 Tax=Thermococcus litoralis (strain ATCC 51850 / DSM 5473 / JCM 8560 / NS-C) TaxID=523849 RepID=H3ZMX7_THELN|nr:hypothetical protein [Thermococcus litoralis]EHR78667.1 hypothetical protein OCC_05906 [Thermococcus litoralis DSM 5473]